MRKMHFLITLHSESPQQLAWCLSHLRRAYATQPITVITDGVDSNHWRQVCLAHQATYAPSNERLKLLSAGARWWNRLLQAGESQTADAVIKMDADTKVHKPLSFFPLGDAFGALQNDGILQGGFQLLYKSTIQKILESGFCVDDAYSDPTLWATNPITLEYALQRQQISTDYVLAHLFRRLGLVASTSPEIDSLWRVWRPFRTSGVCVTHPHKNPTSTQQLRIRQPLPTKAMIRS